MYIIKSGEVEVLVDDQGANQQGESTVLVVPPLATPAAWDAGL